MSNFYQAFTETVFGQSMNSKKESKNSNIKLTNIC